jgi:hypothetical protein
VLIGACFIVNYVTADSKTNWAEGATMVSFYVMIVSDALRQGECLLTTSSFLRMVGCLCMVLPRADREQNHVHMPSDSRRSAGGSCFRR